MRRFALWLTIATLIAAAVIGGVFIIVGDQADVASRVWLTLLLLAGFAGAVILDGVAPEGPNRWYLAASTLLNVFLILIGLFKIWNGPLQPANTDDGLVWGSQLGRWIGLAIVLRLALLITQFWVRQFVAKAKRSATRAAATATVVFVWVTALVFVIPLSFPNLEPIGLSGYADWWWRIAGATTLVMAVTVIIPLVIRAFEPKPPKPQLAQPGYGQQPPFGQAPYGQPPAYGAPYAQQPPVYGAPYPPQQPPPQPTDPANSGGPLS